MKPHLTRGNVMKGVRFVCVLVRWGFMFSHACLGWQYSESTWFKMFWSRDFISLTADPMLSIWTGGVTSRLRWRQPKQFFVSDSANGLTMAKSMTNPEAGRKDTCRT